MWGYFPVFVTFSKVVIIILTFAEVTKKMRFSFVWTVEKVFDDLSNTKNFLKLKILRFMFFGCWSLEQISKHKCVATIANCR